MRRRLGFALLGLTALLGAFLMTGSSPASASPPNISCDVGWVCVSQGGWTGYVAVPGPDKWRSAVWIIEYKDTAYDAPYGYDMQLKIQDTVDSDEPDADGYIQANWASPGNLVWHSLWSPPGVTVRDTNSADWNGVTSPSIHGHRVYDGDPTAWHIQFNITAKGTDHLSYSHDEVGNW